MIMNREEWIDYYESINGHKPSILEIAKAEKNGEIFVISMSHLILHNCRCQHIPLNENTYTIAKTSVERSLSVMRHVFQCIWAVVTRLFTVATWIFSSCVMDCTIF